MFLCAITMLAGIQGPGTADRAGEMMSPTTTIEVAPGSAAGDPWEATATFSKVVPAPLPLGVTSFGAAICGDWLYIIGGHAGARHELVAHDLGVGGRFLERGNVELGGFHEGAGGKAAAAGRLCMQALVGLGVWPT